MTFKLLHGELHFAGPRDYLKHFVFFNNFYSVIDSRLNFILETLLSQDKCCRYFEM
jgi:hypothetical protein